MNRKWQESMKDRNDKLNSIKTSDGPDKRQSNHICLINKKHQGVTSQTSRKFREK